MRAIRWCEGGNFGIGSLSEVVLSVTFEGARFCIRPVLEDVTAITVFAMDVAASSTVLIEVAGFNVIVFDISFGDEDFAVERRDLDTFLYFWHT